MPNIFEGIPDDLPEEFFETLAQADGVKIERIVSQGHRSPEDFWYDQDANEWVIVLQGCATLAFQDPPQEIHLNPGDHINIPAHKKHQVTATAKDQKTIWLAVHYN